jgi:hypothetical protein
MMNLSKKSAFDQQIARIRRLAGEEFSGCLVIFDEDAIPHIRFRIETSSGIRLSNAFPHLEVEEVENLNDDELRSHIRRLCGRPQ